MAITSREITVVVWFAIILVTTAAPTKKLYPVILGKFRHSVN